MEQVRRGRPPKDEADKKSRQFSIRISPGLHAQLAEACQLTGQPIAREIENRLNLSFHVEEQREKEFGSLFIYWLFRILADGAQHIQDVCGQSWREDRFTFNLVRTFANVILDHVQPKNRSKIPQHLKDNPDIPPGAIKKMGVLFALTYLAGMEFHTLGKALPEGAPTTPVMAAAALPFGTKRTASALGRIEREWRKLRVKDQK